VAVLIGLFRMKLPPMPKRVHKEAGEGRIAEGLNYVWRHDTIGVLMVLVAVVSIFAFPYVTLMPIFADDVLRVGKEGYGTLMAITGVGSLFGALSLTVQSGRAQVKRGRIIFAGAVGLPLFLALFSLSTNYLLALASLLVVGWTMISINATTNTIIQTNVPDELRGRVNGVFALLFIGVAPLGNLQAGLVADHFGAPAAVFIGSLICGLVVLYILLRKRHVFNMD
jgi:predicted MFS family arabinose efflux permease